MKGKGYWAKFVKWLRRMLKMYDKEVKELVDDLLDMAFTRVENKIDKAVRRKIRNKVLANILIFGINISTEYGKKQVSDLVEDAITEFAEEAT